MLERLEAYEKRIEERQQQLDEMRSELKTMKADLERSLDLKQEPVVEQEPQEGKKEKEVKAVQEE